MASKSIDNNARRPSSILLYETAEIADFHVDQPPDITESSNETTATAESVGGHTMAVSLWIADPPEMSFFSVICCKPPNSDPRSSNFKIAPHVVGALGSFILLRARFFFRYSRDEFFMYSASNAESPSLERLPPSDASDDLRGVREFGIVPCSLGGHYLLAGLSDALDAPSDYKLHIYSSERKTWSINTLPNPCPELKRITPEKVITIGEGVLGWVDFSCGMLVCDLTQNSPSAYFIPLPEPLPGNRGNLKVPSSGPSPRLFRDITHVNGVLKFVEMEHRVIEIAPEELSDPKDLLYDSDLITSLKRKDMDEKPKKARSKYGWRAVTWSRVISSNCWRKGCSVDVSDIFVDESIDSSLLSGLSSEELTFRDLYSAFPTFSMDDDNILYLRSSAQPNDRNGWIVAVDLGNKPVKALGAWSFINRSPSKQAFRPCTLSNHLNITPGIKVSAYHNIPRVCGSSANDLNNTCIRVDEPTSCKWRSKLQRLSSEEANNSQNEDQSVVPKCISRAEPHPYEDMHVVSTRRLRRMILAGKFNDTQNENSSTECSREVHNDRVSRAPPVQNVLPPQQSIDKWHWHYQSGYSSWAHQNNLPSLESFNKPDGPCHPGYAPMALASTTTLHGYGNYQPPWQQLPSSQSQKQLMPVSYFGHQEVVQPCFNKSDGASYPTSNSLQLPSRLNFRDQKPNRTYGNYQQQWQQHPPESASVSWPPPVLHGGVWIS